MASSREKDLRDGSVKRAVLHGKTPAVQPPSFGAINDPDIEPLSSSGVSRSSETSSLGSTRQVAHSRSTQSLTIAQKLPYYLPCFSWIPSYQKEYFLHDVVAGLSLASYQIPLSMSFASAVAHVPPICGLLGLSIAPMVYTLLGTVPQMIVGPEAAVSMIVGQAIEKIVKHNDGVNPVDVLAVITSSAGAVLLTFGLLRFGFIDNVLCGTLLKGFITAIGLTMILNSTIAILGIDTVLLTLPPDEHVHSAYEKTLFIIHHGYQYHTHTLVVGLGAFVVLLAASSVKKALARRKFKLSTFFPEILVVVVLSTILSAHFRFDKHGVRVLGKVDVEDFKFTLPFAGDAKQWYPKVFSTSFVCAILGFFESSSAGKSLGSSLEMPVSSNRELVALGSAGVVMSFFGCLPSFGGYARSRLNSINGAKTPVSGFIMGLTTLLVTAYMLPYVYHLPICVLNAVIGTVGLSLVQETPKDILFHIRTRGYNELVTFVVTLAASLFVSIDVGVALGCSYSVIRVIKHSTKSRIQFLSQVAGTATLVNADLDAEVTGITEQIVVPGYSDYRSQTAAAEQTSGVRSAGSKLNLEDREGCLIVKIPEPLTFTNASDMKARLRRLELCGSVKSHPAALRSSGPIKHVVFDMNGMTSVDSSAVQMLRDTIEQYQRRGINVFFCRVVKSAKLLDRLQLSGINSLLQDCQGAEFGINQVCAPYYDSILDALKAIDCIEATRSMTENQSVMSFFYDGL